MIKVEYEVLEPVKKVDEAIAAIKAETPYFAESPHQQAIANPSPKPKKVEEVDDGIPF